MRTIPLLALALTGCNAILGIGDVKTSSSTPDAPANLSDAPPGTVIGTSVITYVLKDGTSSTANEDLSGFTIRAWIPDSSAAGFTIKDGTGTADGTFTIADVPDGATYMLELHRADQVIPSLYVTDQHSIDAGYVTLGRPDGVSTTTTTPVTLQLSGMTAWTSTDTLYADAYSIGTENGIYDGGPNPTATNVPKAGDTALNLGVDWKSGYTYDASGTPPRLIQKSHGDDFYLAHTTSGLENDDAGDMFTVGRVIDLFKGDMVDMTDGGSVKITGAFTQTPQTSMQTLRFDLPQYRALSADGNRYYAEDFNCYRLINSAVQYDGRIGPATWGVGGNLTKAMTTVHFTNSKYGDPYDPSWSALMGCDYRRHRLFRMPDGKLVEWISSLGGDSPASDNMTKTPAVAMPTNVKLDGKPFLDGGAIPFDGTGPVTVTWDAVPMAGEYQLSVRHLYVSGTRELAEQVVAISTAGTSFSIPGSVLKKGDFYNVELIALFLTDKTSFAKGHLRKFGFPGGAAVLFSGLYRFSSDCGNHVVDAGETCDDGGESATCDPDCSMRSCGDGYVNATAGEICDDATDSNLCDYDCKVPVCGDGYDNVNVEPCDDGNTTNGDGCSSTCHVEAGFQCTQDSPSVCTPG